MKKNYFQRVADLTPTKFWINNVTREEAKKAIEAGAVGCTQNPSYPWKMLIHEKEGEYAKKILAESMAESNDTNEIQCILQRKLIAGVAEIFLPMFKETNGEHGYVSIQGDPINEHDPQVIIDEARKNRVMSPNIMIKIPGTKAGCEAMKVLIAEDTPINATEVMGINQALEICNMYQKVSAETGKSPKLYVSVITGIFDEYLALNVKENGIDINDDILYYSGMIIAKKAYKLIKDINSSIGFIGGGVRGLHHFTEMVGGDVCITMNWEGHADALLEANYPVVPRLFNPVPDNYLDELLAKSEVFRKGYMNDGLKIDEYEEYGPVQFFTSSFIKAWNSANEMIEKLK